MAWMIVNMNTEKCKKIMSKKDGLTQVVRASIPGADHGYRVAKSAAMTQQEVYSFVADTAVVWLDRELS